MSIRVKKRPSGTTYNYKENPEPEITLMTVSSVQAIRQNALGMLILMFQSFEDYVCNPKDKEDALEMLQKAFPEANLDIYGYTILRGM